MKKLKTALKNLLLLLLLFSLTACTNTNIANKQQTEVTNSNKLEVHFLDVGQADCSLIKLPTGENILVDGGNKDDKNYIADYLEKNGVEHLNAVVATHPHEDHIGSLRDILAEFHTDIIFMPQIDADTLVYTNLLYSIEENNVQEKRVTEPMTMKYGEAVFHIIAPLKAYDDKNNSSIVFKMTYGETSFLFTGDIEKEAEEDILASGASLAADVLKVAHHGSKTSSTEAFLNKVSPQIAVIQVGVDNDYNLPSDSTIERLKAMDLKLYRTDENKEIVIYSDGKQLSVKASAEAAENNEVSKDTEKNNNQPIVSENKDTTSISVIGNSNSKIYHASTCGSLPSEGNRVIFDSKEDAEKAGYRGHKNCIK